MRNAVRLSFAAGLVALLTLPASAEEPYLEFLQALRDREYFDVALTYLEKIEADPNLPQDVKEVLLYEKAMTTQELARRTRSPETQTKLYDQAGAWLEQFTREHPDHPRAAHANSDRAQILLGKARVEIYQSKSPANAGNKAQFQTKARELVAKARGIFQAAHDQHEKAWKQFPVHIDKDRDPDQYEARGVAEVNYMRAQLDLALCTYEEAQTHDENSAEYKKLLTQASTEFAKIHERYRSQVAGLYARMWQGKCFEEQQDLGKALGIYNELLGHPGNTPIMQRLQDQVLQFRLICLNHDQRKDHQLVLQEASPWIGKASTAKQRSTVGLGIRYERARAYEALSNRRELNKADRERTIRDALADANYVNGQPGQYKDVTTFMIQRLNAALGKGTDPKDFAGAMGIGRTMVQQIPQIEGDVEAARRGGKPKEEIAKIEKDLEQHLKETARILKLALDFSNEETEVTQVNVARQLLAYTYYKMDRNVEAAVLGEFVGTRYPTEDPEVARNSAHVALASWHGAYLAAPKENRDFEIAQMIRVANLLAKNWSETDQATYARRMLGQIYTDQKQYAEAAKWFSEVPEGTSDYASAQISTGQAWFSAWYEAARKPAAERAQEEIDKFQADAEKHLKVGIEKSSAGVATDAPLPVEAVAAKLSLTQIKNARGEYQEAIKLLIGDPHPIVGAIEVKEGEQRPTKGIKSRGFYILAYQQLLRAYVGTQEIDKALAAMSKLEALAGGPESEDVVEIYVDLGKELQKEIERVKDDPKRLPEVQASFDKFLDELNKRRDTMRYNSLIWIAQTYYSLGEGLRSGTPGSGGGAGAEYFRKASTAYSDIIAKALSGKTEEDRQFAQSKRLLAVKLELSKSKRREGDFQGSVETIAEVLKDSKNVLEAQFEAALALQDWGQSGQPDAAGKLVEAFEGPNGPPLKDLAWGWGDTAKRLQRLIAVGKATDKQRELYYEACYNGPWCLYEYGRTLSSTDKKKEQLDRARMLIDVFVTVSGDIPDETFERFDALYQDVQKEANPNELPQPLSKATKVDPVAVVNEGPDTSADGEGAKAAPVAVAPAQPQQISTGLILTLLVLLLGATGGLVYVMMKPKPRRRISPSGESAPAFPIGVPSSAASSSAASGKAPRPRTASATSPGAANAGTATATARRPEGKPAPRPQPKGGNPAGTPAAPRPATPKPRKPPE